MSLHVSGGHSGRPSFSDEVSDGDATALARLRRSPRSAGSGFELTGKLGSKVRRTVTLQEFSGGRYVTIAIKNSTRVGNFNFRNVVLDGPATPRVRAPRHKVNPKSRCLPSIAIKPVNVDVQGQSSQLTALPPIVRQGPTPADGLPASTPAATVATSFLASKATELGLSARTLAIREQHATPGGGTAVRVGQSYRGVPVLGGEFVVTLDADGLPRTGALHERLGCLQVTEPISVRVARRRPQVCRTAAEATRVPTEADVPATSLSRVIHVTSCDGSVPGTVVVQA